MTKEGYKMKVDYLFTFEKYKGIITSYSSLRIWPRITHKKKVFILKNNILQYIDKPK